MLPLRRDRSCRKRVPVRVISRPLSFRDPLRENALIGFQDGGSIQNFPMGMLWGGESGGHGDYSKNDRITRSVPQLSRSPYRHELNSACTACASDCPACRWIQRTSDAPWSDSVLNRDADDSRYVALALRLYFENLGIIEGNF